MLNAENHNLLGISKTRYNPILMPYKNYKYNSNYKLATEYRLLIKGKESYKNKSSK